MTIGWNDGIMLIENNEQVKKLLDVLTTPALCDLFCMLHCQHVTMFYDQSMLQFVADNFNEFKGIVKEIPAKSFNSYVPQRAEVGNAWTAGDFILHLPRIQSIRKTAHLKAVLQINRIISSRHRKHSDTKRNKEK